MKNSKIKYKLKINIDTEIEVVNPYPKEELTYIILNTLIQKNIEDIQNKINNIDGFDNISESSDYMQELQEQKKIMQSLINPNFSIEIEKVKENHLKIVK